MALLVILAHIITATERYIKSQLTKGLVRTIESEVNKQPAMSHNSETAIAQQIQSTASSSFKWTRELLRLS